MNAAASLVRVISQTAPSRLRTASQLQVVTWLVLGLALVLRLARYLANRSLWLDEAMLSINIVSRPWSGLFDTLDFSQAAPVGYLVLAKLAVLAFGPNEFALRFVPLVFGLVSSLAFYGVAHRCLGPTGTLVALVLFATSEPLIYYAAEAKQYSGDVALGLLIVWLGLRVRSDAVEAPRLGVLAMTGVLAVWVSHPSVFVLAGVGSVLLADFGRQRRRAVVMRLLAISGGWLISFAVSFMLWSRHHLGDPDHMDFWSAEFAPLPVSLNALKWYVQTAFLSLRRIYGASPLHSEVGTALSGLAVVAAILGCRHLYRSRTRELALLSAPVLFTLLASLLHLYAFRGRLVLFISPILMVLMAAGIEYVFESVRKENRDLAWVIVGLLCGTPLVSGALVLVKPPPAREEIKPVLAYLSNEMRVSDTVFVDVFTYPAFLYYTKHSGHPYQLLAHDLVEAETVLSSMQQSQMSQLIGRARVWILLGNPSVNTTENIEAVPLCLLDSTGKRLDEFHANGASLYLYDLTQPPAGCR